VNAEYFRTLFDYNYWARDRILDAMRDMSDVEYARENGFTYGSIRGILTHCLDAEHVWRSRLEGQQGGGISQTATVTPVLLAACWRDEEVKMRTYLARLTDEDLASDVLWRNRDGSEERLPNRWLTLAHVVNHSTQHRSEAAEALTMAGRSPGNLDLGFYAHERRTLAGS
jgi:uncharacterized damage-inducible protein DinB